MGVSWLLPVEIVQTARTGGDAIRSCVPQRGSQPLQGFSDPVQDFGRPFRSSHDAVDVRRHALLERRQRWIAGDGRWCTRQIQGEMAPSPKLLRDDRLATDEIRAPGRQHPVQHRHADGSLGLLGGEAAGSQTRSDQSLVTTHRRFY